MVEFSKEFFEKEYRWEHPVGELMKRVWAGQIEVLQRVIVICEKYNLTYYMYWGTLLGTVRHKGFIPWDDDIDIALKRDDYLKLLEVAPKELPQGYCLLNMYTEDEWGEYFSRITNSNGINFSDKWLEEYHGCPFSIGIDIFPLYYIPDDKQLAEEQVGLLQLIGQLYELTEYRESLQNQLQNAGELRSCEESIRGGMDLLEQYTGYRFHNGRSIQAQLYMLYDQVCQCYEAEESSYLTAFPVHMMNGYRVPKELLEKTIQMPFENIEVSVPVGYHEILTMTYRDYMTPRKGGSTHGEMFYVSQLEVLAKRIEELAWADAKEMPKSVSEMTTITVQDKEVILPKEWLEKIEYWDGQGKTMRRKVVVFCNSTRDFLIQDVRVIEKLRYVLTVFKENPEVVLWWRPCRMSSESVKFLRLMVPDILTEYENILEEYKERSWGICDETEDEERAVLIGDAFYGDAGEVSEKFMQTEKLMMFQDYKIF